MARHWGNHTAIPTQAEESEGHTNRAYLPNEQQSYDGVPETRHKDISMAHKDLHVIERQPRVIASDQNYFSLITENGELIQPAATCSPSAQKNSSAKKKLHRTRKLAVSDYDDREEQSISGENPEVKNDVCHISAIHVVERTNNNYVRDRDSVPEYVVQAPLADTHVDIPDAQSEQWTGDGDQKCPSKERGVSGQSTQLQAETGSRLGRQPSLNGSLYKKHGKPARRGHSFEGSPHPNKLLTLGVGDSAIRRLVRQLSGQPTYVAQEQDSGRRQPKTYFDLSLFSLCCCLSPLGLVAIIMSVLSDSTFKIGNTTKAKKYGTVALAMSITGMITSVVIAITLLVTLAYPHTGQ